MTSTIKIKISKEPSRFCFFYCQPHFFRVFCSPKICALLALLKMNARTTAQLWRKAISIIDSKLLIALKQRQKLRAWLNMLGKESEDGERLVLCVAIDLASEAYRPEKLSDIRMLFASIDVNAPNARSEFSTRLVQLNDTGLLNCASRFSGNKDHVSPAYAVVMRIEKFFYCAGTSLFRDTRPDRIRLQRRIARNPKFRLRSPDAWWTHNKGIVWLAAADELQKLLDAVSLDKRASSAKNALGIRHPNIKPETPVEYVLVEYSPSFSQPCYQPTALDAWWKDKGQYYLSWHEDDNWGRTQNCLGTSTTENLRERVHQCYRGTKCEFTMTYLGVYPGDAAFATELKAGRKALREAAYNRLQRVPATCTTKGHSKKRVGGA